MDLLLSKFIPKTTLGTLNCLSVSQFLEVNGLGFMFVLVLQDKLIYTQEAIMDLFLEIKKLKENKVYLNQIKKIKYF